MAKPNRKRKLRTFTMSDGAYNKLVRSAARNVLPVSREIEQMIFGRRKKRSD